MDDYFAAVRKTREAVPIPADLAKPSSTLQMPPADVEAKMADANASLPKGAFAPRVIRT
jgi:hypothetical protein